MREKHVFKYHCQVLLKYLRQNIDAFIIIVDVSYLIKSNKININYSYNWKIINITLKSDIYFEILFTNDSIILIADDYSFFLQDTEGFIIIIYLLLV